MAAGYRVSEFGDVGAVAWGFWCWNVGCWSFGCLDVIFGSVICTFRCKALGIVV